MTGADYRSGVLAFVAAYPYWPIAAFAFGLTAITWLVLQHIADRQLRALHPRQKSGRKVTAVEVRRMFRNQSGLCNNPYCRADLKVTRFEIDHIVAKSRGGPDGVANAQLLCRDCNQMKCAQPWSVFLIEYQEQRTRRMKPRWEKRNEVTYLPRR
jgi:5-methylcytosine-specific restriction endonuclease McrA